MLIEHQHPHNKSIMAALLGKPNAGKSSLINNLLGFDLTIVSHKPQTTRNHFQCAFTIDRTEVVLVDTPGIHKSNLELNKRMVGQASFGSEGADLNLILLDLSSDPIQDLKEVMSSIEGEMNETWVVLTKVDLKKKSEDDIKNIQVKIQEMYPDIKKFFVISSKDQTNIHLLTAALCDRAPNAPHLYPNGDVSNKNMRFFVAEYIREQAFNLLNEELPYEIAVVIDEFKDVSPEDEDSQHDKNLAYISASILVNRPSQRGIVVGSGGSLIKRIGTDARKKIEAMMGGKVHLNLHVKVSPKWFKNNFVLEEIGLPRVKDSARVWRKK
jgi:GTP-binding protein Era